MNKNAKFAKKYGVKILPFNKLPAPARYAIIHYMVVDGEAWDVSDQLAESFAKGHKMMAKGSKGSYDKARTLHRNAVIESLKFYTEKYGDRKFGYGLIPTKALVKEIWDRDDGVKDWKEDGTTFEEYQECFFKEGEMPDHPKTNRWSCIMSGFDFEVLQDGWHRFHSYVKRGDKNIPCVHYA